MREYGAVDEAQISVLYVVTAPEISYEPLIDQFGCRFIEEASFFDDLRREIGETSPEYVLFLVDDLIFRDPFRITDAESLLERRSDVDAFCFRLGDNIENAPKPDFDRSESGFLIWDTDRKLGRYWNYIWDMSSSLYRRGFVDDYLSRCSSKRVSFPNPLESYYYRRMPTTRCSLTAEIVNRVRFPFRRRRHRIACCEKSKCLTQGINLVAAIGSERTEHFNPVDLHQRMLDGFVADYRSLQSLDLKTPQPGHVHFKLVPEKELTHVERR
jgi:hypothetical protein